jgi:hypothetical protein
MRCAMPWTPDSGHSEPSVPPHSGGLHHKTFSREHQVTGTQLRDTDPCLETVMAYSPPLSFHACNSYTGCKRVLRLGSTLAPWAAHQLTTTIRTARRHLLCTSGAERTFITTDIRLALGRQAGLALFTDVFHLQGHGYVTPPGLEQPNWVLDRLVYVNPALFQTAATRVAGRRHVRGAAGTPGLL